MSTLTPICVACALEMRCAKNDRLVNDPAAACGPSTYWYGDEYECPQCKVRIVTGFGAAMQQAPARDAQASLQFEYERPSNAPEPPGVYRPGVEPPGLSREMKREEEDEAARRAKEGGSA